MSDANRPADLTDSVMDQIADRQAGWISDLAAISSQLREHAIYANQVDAAALIEWAAALINPAVGDVPDDLSDQLRGLADQLDARAEEWDEGDVEEPE